MPKQDVVYRINQNPVRDDGAGIAISSLSPLPYRATLAPTPFSIPVSGADGKLHSGWLPIAAEMTDGADILGGQVYIAPWTRLAEGVDVTDNVIRVRQAIFANGDKIVIAHQTYGREELVVIGDGEALGGSFQYPVMRAANPRSFPAGTPVLNLGNENDGGYMTIVSGDQNGLLKAPHINMYAREQGEWVRKVRIGRLSGLSSAEKARFPSVTNWNVFGLYADAAFLRGHIVADAGDIAGDLTVGGRLRVLSGVGLAGVHVGDTESGWGLVLLNREGRPVFGAVTPYLDASGQMHDVAVFLDNDGKHGLYYHRDPDTGRYRLDISVETLVDGRLQADTILAGEGSWPGTFTGLRLGRSGLQSYGTNYALQIEIDTRDGRLYFGRREGWLDESGITLDARVFAEGTDELEHTLHWLNSSSLGDHVGAAIGSYPRGGWFAVARRRVLDLGGLSAQAVDDFFEAGLFLRPGETTSLEGQDVLVRADGVLTLQSAGRNVLRGEGGDVYLENAHIGDVLHVGNGVVRVGAETGDEAMFIVEQRGRPALRLQDASGYFADVKLGPNSVNISGNASLWFLAPARGADGYGYILPASPYVNIGSAGQRFRAVYAEHGHFGALGSQTALTGQFYLTKRRATLAVPLEPDNTIAYFRESGLRVGEFYRFEALDGAWETIRINTEAAPAGEFYEYEIARAQDADPHSDAGHARYWDAGEVGVSLGGNAQDGYIRLWGADDNNPDTGPALVILQRVNDDAPGSVRERAVFGNLNGWYGYDRNVYGVAMGDPEGAWSVVEPEGLRIMYGRAEKAFYGETIVLGRDSELSLVMDNTRAGFYWRGELESELSDYGIKTYGIIDFYVRIPPYSSSYHTATIKTYVDEMTISVWDHATNAEIGYHFYNWGFSCDGKRIAYLADVAGVYDAVSYRSGSIVFGRLWRRWFMI